MGLTPQGIYFAVGRRDESSVDGELCNKTQQEEQVVTRTASCVARHSKKSKSLREQQA